MLADFLDLLREGGPYIAATVAVIAAVIGKRSRTENISKTTTEVVDDSVLGRFEELFDRIGQLETDLAEAKADLAQALVEIRELRKLEEYLQAKLHEKDKELSAARVRIAYLEKVCETHGLRP